MLDRFVLDDSFVNMIPSHVIRNYFWKTALEVAANLEPVWENNFDLQFRMLHNVVVLGLWYISISQGALES